MEERFLVATLTSGSKTRVDDRSQLTHVQNLQWRWLHQWDVFRQHGNACLAISHELRISSVEIRVALERNLAFVPEIVRHGGVRMSITDVVIALVIVLTDKSDRLIDNVQFFSLDIATIPNHLADRVFTGNALSAYTYCQPCWDRLIKVGRVTSVRLAHSQAIWAREKGYWMYDAESTSGRCRAFARQAMRLPLKRGASRAASKRGWRFRRRKRSKASGRYWLFSAYRERRKTTQSV